jgi:chromosome condensin MukBEF MukE localization factor
LESRPLREELAPFLCAIYLSPCRLLGDAGDLDARELLAVALTLLVTGLVLELLNNDLGATKVAYDLCGDNHVLQRLRAVRDGVTVNEEDGSQRNVAILVSLDAVEDDDCADLYLFLPTTGAHNCVNHLE